MEKVLVALSGGVDSAVAALLLKEKYECFGATMQLFCGEVEAAKPRFAEQNIRDAASVAENLGIPFSACDFTEEFEKRVIGSFISAYEQGLTPNPCIECNKFLKFQRLLEYAKQNGCEKIATGHYARVRYDEDSGRYLLLKGKDLSKDQSYVLYCLTQEQLSRTIFPLGEYSKDEIRAIAEKNGFVNANKKDSQDICFVPDGDYAAFISRRTGKVYPQGDYIDEAGNVLGKHKGIIHYTIGQRKGLGIALGRHVFVKEKNVQGNTVTLCDEAALFYKNVIVGEVNLISAEEIKEPIRAAVKLRYRHAEQNATIHNIGGGRVRVEFDEPQRAPSSGQAAVFYIGDSVLGGGIIIRGENDEQHRKGN